MTWRAAAVVAVIAVTCSAPALRNGFVFDDVPVAQRDERIRILSPRLLSLPYWNDETRDRLYRPATTASLAVDWAVGEGSALPFHLTNVVLNAVAAVLVFALGLRILRHGAAAFVAAAWFAVHPVHVEAAAGIVGRSELLAAVAYLAAVCCYLAESDHVITAPGGMRRALAAAGTLILAAIAFGAKEHALTLPAMLLLADAWQSRATSEPMRRVLGRHVTTWLGVAVLAAGYLAARTAVLGTALGAGSVAAGLENLGMTSRAMVMAPALLVWGRLLVFPLRLSADYAPAHFIPQSSMGWQHLLALLLIVLLVIAAWRLRHRIPSFAFGFAWFAVAASVASNILVPTGVLIAERTLYLPSAGAAIMAGALWLLLDGRRWVWPVTATLLVLLAARSISRASVWRDEERFYQALIQDAPASYRSQWARGSRAFAEGRHAEGERRYLAAINAYGRDGAVMQELGEHYLQAGALEPAARWLLEAWRVEPHRFDAALEAVVVRLRLNRADSAAALGEAALQRFPTAPSLLIATGEAWARLGQPVRDLTLRRRAAFAAPRAWQFQWLAADGALRAGRCDEALVRAERAVALAPGEAAPRQLVAQLRTGRGCPPR